MARYIDAEPLENILKNEYKDIVAGRYPFNIVVWDIVRILEEQPTADVVEVVHGEWERIPYSFAGGYRCSCCGCKSTEKHWDYCPKCGTKMDGKKVE